MDNNVKTYCPYCGISLTITHEEENKKTTPSLYHIEACCCNCEKKFHWLSHARKDNSLLRTGFSQFF